MRFVADHGFFQGVARQLVCLGHDVDWHFPWCDPGVGDPTVVLYALKRSRIVLTEDRGFLAHDVVNEHLNESMGIVVGADGQVLASLVGQSVCWKLRSPTVPGI